MKNWFKRLVHFFFIVFVACTKDRGDCDIKPLDTSWPSDNICKNLINSDIYAIRCDGRNMFLIPEHYPKQNASIRHSLYLLDLSNNDINRVNNESFMNKTNLVTNYAVCILLQGNPIRTIEAKAFIGLENLVFLNLSQNNIEWKSCCSSGLFRPLLSLKSLDLRGNIFTNLTGLDIELMTLKNLTSLYLNPSFSSYEFGPGFQNLTGLKNLSLSGINTTSCRLLLVSNETFRYLSQLKGLFMSDCNINEIEPNALKPLIHLKDLDISYNVLKFKGMNQALFGLRYSTTLKTLKVHSLHERRGLGIQLKESDLEYLRTLRNLTVLQMDINKIAIIDPQILTRSFFPPSLQTLTMCGNRLKTGEYLNLLYKLREIKTLDLSRQMLDVSPFHYNPKKLQKQLHEFKTENTFVKRDMLNINSSHVSTIETDLSPIVKLLEDGGDVKDFMEYVKVTCGSSNICAYVICSPPNLQNLTWQKSFLYTAIPLSLICYGENLKEIDLSFNLIPTWKGPVFGLSNVIKLNLSTCFCSNVSRHFFLSFPLLENLDISENILYESFDPNKSAYSDKIFSIQRKLKILNISNNRLYAMHKNIFQNTTNLEELYASSNFFSIWESTLTNTNLKLLDVSGNKLSDLPEDLRDFLDQKNATVNFAYNKIDCKACASVSFLNWLAHTKVNVIFADDEYCEAHGKIFRFKNKEDIKRILKILTYQTLCPNWIKWTIAGSCAAFGFIISFVAGVSIYKNRWKLRYFYYNRKRRHIHKGFEHIFSYDAYISYAKGQASFIRGTLVPGLEEQYDLRLWISDRDSAAGVGVAENIVFGIGNSRKTVLLIDEEYLVDSWCDYDMNMALIESIETSRESIIIVLMSSCRMNELPVRILKALDQKQQIEYPDDPENLNTFWMNLVSEITK